MNSNEAIEYLENTISKETDGLPEELFLFVSRITPLISVDLLIKNEANETLFTWRDDVFFGKGWHLPGGVIRHNELFANRIVKVGQIELGASLEYDEQPCTFVQDLNVDKKDRGHFIAFLYNCRLLSDPDESKRYYGGSPRVGEWAWFSGSPNPLLKVHEVYSSYFK
ncbi:NUDIX hydrolase [Paenibacillus agricola]|uniref:NUDIX hydrolase n=1 Tax=Paenibacillus agricola TaxID=2716264 RepID=A0ABX0IYE9_9BACL|nr:NUDIX hydrolase [Paenibacillus agricola]NHN28566.1 NUDIX hydrolase [Paenibacillus agricola]